jgi:alpha-tubulin suppressor-like RCC1 family protein
VPITQIYIRLVAFVVGVSACLLPASEFRIDGFARHFGQSEVHLAGEAGFYYILWRGDSITAVRLATDLALSSGGLSILTDENATNGAQFYRVEKISLASLRDTDGDGISDAWELLHRHPKAALDATDAKDDHTGNGIPDRLDALREDVRPGVRGHPVVAAGANHSLAIKSDGTLWGWGDNFFGELGSNAFTETNSPTQIGTATNWSAVSIGGLTSYGLRSDGTMWIWGLVGTNVIAPTQVGTNDNWIGLPGGRAESNPTALQGDGTRWQFVGSFSNPQPYGASNDWSAVADGPFSDHWAIKQDGTLWNGLSLFDTNPVWSSISAGVSHALAVRTNGTLWSWATTCCYAAVDGQLGLGDAQASMPTQIGTDTWVAAAAGSYHSVGIKTDGSLWWWGVNYGFAPSESGLVQTNLPTRIGTNTGWLAVAAEASHTVALREDGTIWTFGLNTFGKLGNRAVALVKQPTQVGTDHDWNSIGVGTFFSFGLKTNGTLWSWGGNSYGVLGVGNFTSGFAPRQIPGSNWIAVSGGGDHTVALQRDGSLWVWGKYIRGNNPVPDVFTNLPVRLGTDSDWRFISAGGRHALALKTDGSLWSWGRDSGGTLGTEVGYSSLPLQVGTSFWTNVSAGHANSLGIHMFTSLWSWGQQIRDFGLSDFKPQQIADGFSWKLVANAKRHLAGRPHALAVKHNGTLWSWGVNLNGQLGNGTTTAARDPGQLGLATNWSAIAVGGAFSGALQQDGSLWLWGDNSAGQLGTGSRNGTNLVSRTGAEINWKELALGYQHTLALKADGSIWVWGDNSYGQCAQPALFEPVPVAGTNWGKPAQFPR